MITRRFNNILDELEGLIKEEIWSASRELSPFDDFAQRALVAVSGGIDSMCLADLYYGRMGFHDFAIAHCNFNLRGEESDGDQEMVRQWAEARGIRVHFISFDTQAFAQEKGLSIEMAARELRYTWFAELCRKHGYAYVAVAHHADDNAETMMLNLVRGTGMKGISGMKAISQLPYSKDRNNLRLVRPLLDFTRKQLEGYAYGHDVPYRNDSTNDSVEYKRNSIRHEVFPVFERMNPSYVRTLNREMRYFADAEQIIGAWCAAAVENVVSYEEAMLINTEALLGYPQWRYLLYYILEPYGFLSSVLASLEELLLSDRTISGKKFTSDSYTLITERGGLRIVLTEALNARKQEESVLVEGAGLYRLGNVNFIVELCPWTPGKSRRQPEGVLAFDADALTFPFVCRQWRRGDWMVPFGMKGRKKVSDIFADLKWNELEKADAVIIIESGEEDAQRRRVAGLLGVRMDERFKIGDNTQMIIRIRKQ